MATLTQTELLCYKCRRPFIGVKALYEWIPDICDQCIDEIIIEEFRVISGDSHVKGDVWYRVRS